MPQAALAAAVWVGSQVAFAAAAVGASTFVAAAAGYATLGATLAAEVYTLSAATKALTPKIKDPGAAVQWQADPRAGIPYAFGRSAVAGKIAFNQAAGSSNKFLNFATVYTGAGPIDGFETFQGNDSSITFSADSGEGASGYYLNRMWQKRQLGALDEPQMRWTATGSKDTPANHGGMPVEWTASHKLSGYAASLWALEYDTSRYASGVPEPKMVGRWVKVYDPRKDSSYPGGSGPHRYADPSNKAAYLAAMATWEWSDDPYLHGLMWCLGRWVSDPDRPDLPLIRTHGLGAPIAMVEVPSFVEGANVALANGWTCGGLVDSTDDKWEVLKAFLQAGGGKPVLMGAKVGCIVNTPRVSLATLTKADAVGDVSVAGAVDIDERLNTIWPSYTEEAQNWSVVTPDAPVQVSAYLEPDKGERSIPVTYQFVQKAQQTGQLARYDIEDSRELTPITIPAKPWTMWLRPGDCFTASEPEWGLNGQKLLILKRTRDPATMTVSFVCRTETDGKHPFALGQTLVPPDSPALTGIDPNVVPLPAEGSWTIVGGVTASADGSLPAIVIQGETDLYDAVSIVVDYREVIGGGASYGPWQSQTFPASARQLVVTGVKPGAVYQVRVRYITAKGVENPDQNTDLGSVTTGQLIAAKIGQFTAAQIAYYIQLTQLADANARDALLRVAAAMAASAALYDDLLKELMPASGRPVGATIDDQVRIVETQGETIIEHHTEMVAGLANAAAALQIEALTRASADSALSVYQIDLAALVANNYATVTSQLSTLTTNTSATATSLLLLTASFNSNVTTVSNQLTALSNENYSQGISISTLTSTSNGLVSSVSIMSTTLSTLSGQVGAAFGLRLAAGNKVIGFKGINNGIEGGFLFDTDYFGISTGLGAVYPFFVSGSTVYMTNVVISGSLLILGTVDAPQLASRAATSTSRSSASWTLTGSGGQQTILSHYVYLAKAGTVDSDSVIAQHFPSGDRNWRFELWIDGEMQFPCFGANGQDSVALSGSKDCGAGYRLVEVYWTAPSAVNIDYRVLKSMGSW